jgi:hypothetical protein
MKSAFARVCVRGSRSSHSHRTEGVRAHRTEGVRGARGAARGVETPLSGLSRARARKGLAVEDENLRSAAVITVTMFCRSAGGMKLFGHRAIRRDGRQTMVTGPPKPDPRYPLGPASEGEIHWQAMA